MDLDEGAFPIMQDVLLGNEHMPRDELLELVTSAVNRHIEDHWVPIIPLTERNREAVAATTAGFLFEQAQWMVRCNQGDQVLGHFLRCPCCDKHSVLRQRGIKFDQDGTTIEFHCQGCNEAVGLTLREEDKKHDPGALRFAWRLPEHLQRAIDTQFDELFRAAK